MDLFVRPSDLVPAYQDRAVRSLGGQAGPRLGPEHTHLNVADLKRRLQNALNEMRRGGDAFPFFRAALAEAVPGMPISSAAWNDAQDRIYVDLYALYQSLKESQVEDASVGELTREKFLQTRASILKILNEVRLFQFLKANPDYQDAKFIDFNAGLNESMRMPLASVDKDVRILELSPRARDTYSQANFGDRTTRVDVRILGGKSSGLQEDFSTLNMLDSNPESFWADLVMTDGPVRQTYAPSGNSGLGESIDSEGLIVEVVLTFSHVGILNNLKILPFGEYPLRVIDVAYKESTAQSQWQMVPGFQVEDPTLDWVEVNFEPRTIAQMRVTLEQVNYRVNTYHLPRAAVKNAEFWAQLNKESLRARSLELDVPQGTIDDVEIRPGELNKVIEDGDFKEAMSTEELASSRQAEFTTQSTIVRKALESGSSVSPQLANVILEPMFGEKIDTEDEIVSLRKYEYVFGLRSIEVNRVLYEPLGHYSSQKFTTKASVLDVELQTEERHIQFDDGLSKFTKTSIEYEVELGADRRYPLAPRNWRQGSDLIVPGEYLQFNRTSRTAVTRLPISSGTTTLRRNGERVPASHYTVTELQVTDPYANSSLIPALRARNASPSNTQIGRGVVEITNPESWDPNAVYTIQYVARDDADKLIVDGFVNSTDLVEPEVFENTDRNNAVLLKRIPYVDYNIINSSKWAQTEEGVARWKFSPSKPNYRIGTLQVVNASPNLTGTNTVWLTNVDMTEPNAIRVKGRDSIYKLQSVATNTTAVLGENYLEASGSGLEYVIGQYFESDGRIYCFDDIVYEPIRVYVNDVKAENLTDYVSGEHQAFVDVPMSSRQIQYIHAGGVLYFNQPIQNARIEVFYAWLTEYVRVNAVLRCNIPIQTVLTPQVNTVRVQLRTSKL